MALQLRGRDLCTHGEFNALMRGLNRDGPTEGVLQALYLGEDVDPADLHECLDIEARINARNPGVEKLIDELLGRIEDRHPEEVPA